MKNKDKCKNQNPNRINNTPTSIELKSDYRSLNDLVNNTSSNQKKLNSETPQDKNTLPIKREDDESNTKAENEAQDDEINKGEKAEETNIDEFRFESFKQNYENAMEKSKKLKSEKKPDFVNEKILKDTHLNYFNLIEVCKIYDKSGKNERIDLYFNKLEFQIFIENSCFYQYNNEQFDFLFKHYKKLYLNLLNVWFNQIFWERFFIDNNNLKRDYLNVSLYLNLYIKILNFNENFDPNFFFFNFLLMIKYHQIIIFDESTKNNICNTLDKINYPNDDSCKMLFKLVRSLLEHKKIYSITFINEALSFIQTMLIKNDDIIYNQYFECFVKIIYFYVFIHLCKRLNIEFIPVHSYHSYYFDQDYLVSTINEIYSQDITNQEDADKISTFINLANMIVFENFTNYYYTEQLFLDYYYCFIVIFKENYYLNPPIEIQNLYNLARKEILNERFRIYIQCWFDVRNKTIVDESGRNIMIINKNQVEDVKYFLKLTEDNRNRINSFLRIYERTLNKERNNLNIISISSNIIKEYEFKHNFTEYKFE